MYYNPVIKFFTAMRLINGLYLFIYYMHKIKGFKDKNVCVTVSTFLIFMFVDQLLIVDVFSRLYYLTYANKTNNGGLL